MSRNGRVVRVVLVVVLFLVVTGAHAGLRIGSWNLEHLGWNNGKNTVAVARVLARFDLVALQEVMDVSQLPSLVALLEAHTGEDWQASGSRLVGGNGYRESYAFVWRTARVRKIGHDTVYRDRADKFLREPYSAVFAATDGSVREFIAATIHVVYGDGVEDRVPELRALAAYWLWLERTFEQRPIVLMGDFNLSIAGQSAWQPLLRLAEPHVRQRRTTLSSTPGRYASAYDHFWTSPALGVTSAGVLRVPELFGISHAVALDHLSDHAPIYLTLGRASVDRARFAHSPFGALPGATGGYRRACIDINRASATRLEALAHVGPARARAIIAGRPWPSLQSLVRIDGLSAAGVADIRRGGRVCDMR